MGWRRTARKYLRHPFKVAIDICSNMPFSSESMRRTYHATRIALRRPSPAISSDRILRGFPGAGFWKHEQSKYWSERRDLNSRPPVPQTETITKEASLLRRFLRCPVGLWGL